MDSRITSVAKLEHDLARVVCIDNPYAVGKRERLVRDTRTGEQKTYKALRDLHSKAGATDDGIVKTFMIFYDLNCCSCEV